MQRHLVSYTDLGEVSGMLLLQETYVQDSGEELSKHVQHRPSEGLSFYNDLVEGFKVTDTW